MPDRLHKNWKTALRVKNFERWIYQRDTEGARAEPTERVDVPDQMFDFAKKYRYDDTARKTDVSQGQDRIRFAVDDTFLSGGPHHVAVKVTYLDRENAEWAFEYHTAGYKMGTREVVCADSGQVKTVTWILNDAVFSATGYTGEDFQVHSIRGDAIIRFIRIIKRDPGSVQLPAKR